jgi:hypothetical protein
MRAQHVETRRWPRQGHAQAGSVVLTLSLIGLSVVDVGSAFAQGSDRLARINGNPNINGIWQAVNTAHWNVEAHSAEALEDFWQLGAIGAIPAGRSVVEGGTIPYLPAARAQRDANRAGWPDSDPEAKCFRAGIPRSTYLPYPFEIIQGDGDILFVYEYAAANRTVRMNDHLDPDEVLVDQYLGWSNGRWEGEALVIEVFGLMPGWLDRAGNYHRGTVTERYTPMGENHLWYEATIDDPSTFSREWTIAMPLYRRIEANAEIFEYRCVEFAEPMMYGDLLKEPLW